MSCIDTSSAAPRERSAWRWWSTTHRANPSPAPCSWAGSSIRQRSNAPTNGSAKSSPAASPPPPRYRYNSSTGETQFIPPEAVQALLAQGRSAELLGTLEPDVVIHLPGQPLHVQLVLD